MERVICVAIGYIFGLLQTSYLYGKLYHIDIREHGSGNAGTTNALRTLGKKAGVITFLGDCLKCVLAIALVRVIFKDYSNVDLLAMYAGMGAVLGHNYPFYMKFQGGKGIATTAGLILSTNPLMALVTAIVFFLIVGVTKYVSLGSLVMVVLFVVEVVIYGQFWGGFQLSQPELYEIYAIAIFLAISAFYKHRANIKRLLNGTENKLGSSKKKEQNA